jgi:hypothetical protein
MVQFTKISANDMAGEEPLSPQSKRRAIKKKPKTVARSASRSQSDEVKGKPWTFPKHTLEEAIRVAKAIEEKNGGNPMRAEMLARAVGFNQPADWRFRDLLSAARIYGLVSGSGPTATVGLEEIGQEIVAPSSPQQRKEALRKAFHNVGGFQESRRLLPWQADS